MEECDYCGESFADEGAYLDHLAAEHEEDLGRIDRRRVADHQGTGDGDEGFGLGPTILVGLLGFAGILVIYVTFVMGGGGGGGTAEAREIPDDPLLADAESFPVDGPINHVRSSQDLDYDRVPPLSGQHYFQSAGAGFYEEMPALGHLVHSLEHGHVVVYYDPGALSSDTRAGLENLTSTYTGQWSGVIAAPNPNDDPAAPYVLTAWQVRLRMDEYDPETVDAFLDAFRGRGPENPVR